MRRIMRRRRAKPARARMRAILAIGLAVFLVGPRAASALDFGQWVPGLRVTPFLTEKVEYNSNIFQVPTGAQDDIIFWTMPGVIVDYTLGNYTLSAGYRAEIQNYLELTSQDFVNHVGAVQFLAELPKLTLGLRDDFVRTNEPPTTELTGPIPSNTNILRADAEYRVTSRVSLGANVLWTYVAYDDDFADVINRNEVGGGASVFWRVFARGDVRFDAGYRRAMFWNDETRDVGVFDFTVGLRGDLTERISSSFRAGVQVRHAERGREGFTGLVFAGDFVYQPFSTTTITLSGLRTPIESTFADDPYYVTTSGALSVRQEILRRLVVEARIAGGINDYPEQATFAGQTGFRRDSFLVGGLGAEYQVLPWLVVGLEYRHNFRRSNFDIFDFDQDRVWAKATLQF